MLEEKKNAIFEEEAKKQNEEKEVSLDNLDEVTGGSIRNVRYTPTKDISKDTQNKI